MVMWWVKQFVVVNALHMLFHRLKVIMYQACVNPYAYALWRLQTAYKAGYNNLVILSLWDGVLKYIYVVNSIFIVNLVTLRQWRKLYIKVVNSLIVITSIALYAF